MAELKSECLKLCIPTTGANSSKETMQSRMRAHYKEHTDCSVPGGRPLHENTDSDDEEQSSTCVIQKGNWEEQKQKELVEQEVKMLTEMELQKAEV